MRRTWTSLSFKAGFISSTQHTHTYNQHLTRNATTKNILNSPTQKQIKLLKVKFRSLP
uniref:Uncharacterized protein n=1 Tax=Rhizophora mucronata TaxID=61149 RepID=A0A2P2QGM0_RHIMU